MTKDITRLICMSPAFSIYTVCPGYDFTSILTKEGEVYAWGKNIQGQLGNGTREQCFFSQKISELSHIRKLVSGACYSLAITEGGTVVSWGSNSYTQLGIGDTGTSQTSPVTVVLPDKACGIASSGWRNFYVKLEDGRVFFWGGVDRLGKNLKTCNRKKSTIQMIYCSMLHLLSKDGHTITRNWNNSFKRAINGRWNCSAGLSGILTI